MGYDTRFKGSLSFNLSLNDEESQKIKTFLGADCRNHLEWNATHLTWINLKLTDDLKGIEWNGSQKTYNIAEKINVIIKEMQKEFPNFGLTGKILAQGDDIDDRYYVEIIDNKAVKTLIDDELYL